MKKVRVIGTDGEERPGNGFSYEAMSSAVGQSARSRYGGLDFIIDSNTGRIYHETFRRFTPPPTRRTKWFKIPPGYEYRPDLLAYEVYGSASYMHAILDYNDIDLWQFVRGAVVAIPAVEDVVTGV